MRAGSNFSRVLKPDNYFERIEAIGVSKLPKNLKEGHEWVSKATRNGETWERYFNNEKLVTIGKTFFRRLNEWRAEQLAKERKKATTEKTNAITKSMPKSTTATKPKPKAALAPTQVERVSDVVTLATRFVRLHGKEKTYNSLRLMLNTIDRAFLEKRISQETKHASLIKMVQGKLRALLDKMKPGDIADIRLEEKTVTELLPVTAVEQQMLSIRFLKRYVSLQGRQVEKERVKALYNSIVRAVKRDKLSENDPYWKRIAAILKSMEELIRGKSEIAVLELQKAELSGIAGILSALPAEGLSGLDQECSKASSNLATGEVRGGQVREMEFETFQLPGRVGVFLGELDRNMAAFALTGDSGAGKSYFSFMLAKAFLLAGLTLKYFSLEEGIGKVTQEKLTAYDIGDEIVLEASGKLMDVKDAARKYDVVVVDSFNKLGAKAEDFENLRKAHPETIFIMIFQKTTNGTMRGGSSTLFDSTLTLDVRIEDGKRIAFAQKSRYGNIGQRFLIE